jgi:hypothetical protein
VCRNAERKSHLKKFFRRAAYRKDARVKCGKAKRRANEAPKRKGQAFAGHPDFTADDIL